MRIDYPTAKHIPDLRELWQEAFGDTDLFLDHFFRTGFSDRRCRCIFREDRPVAVLYWFDCRWQEKTIAYIYAVATAKSQQGQGLCHRLMADTEALLAQLGYAGVALVPAKPTLFDFYEKMGYRCFGGIRQWQCSAGKALSIRELSPEAYAAARHQYLPASSVLQEGALLDFLSTYTRFYEGQDFLLCCTEENDQLIGYELLGDPETAAGILAALGCPVGTFRSPGESAFAMYRSLTEDPVAPSYLAFALD